MTETEHIDPTGLGLLLVAAVSFPLAFAQFDTDILANISGLFAICGIAIIAVGYLAYKANSTFGFTVFSLVGIAVLLSSGAGSAFIGAEMSMDAYGNLVFGIAFVFAIIWSLWIKTPKTLTLLLVTTALIFLIIGIGTIAKADLATVLGVVAFANFALNFYTGISLLSDGKLPVI